MADESSRLLPSSNKWQWWERPDDAHGGKLRTISVDSLPLVNGIQGDPEYGNIHGTSGTPHEHAEDMQIGSLAPKSSHHQKKLGEFLSTAISGNDITSSVLYVSGYAAFISGIWAPISLLLVAVLLYLFRSIYTEVVTALPMNGGTYNALLNTTSKKIASVAGALSLLSYVATAVVSANSAMEYFQGLWSNLPILYAVIILLLFFALLNIMGITESAVVAAVLFTIHCTTLLILIAACAVHFGRTGTDILIANYHATYEKDVNPNGYNPAMLIFLGYGASMLGITGFETSANFVEEQKKGVFPKTLRNMWIAVAFFNPVISFLAMGILPLDQQIKNPAALLANMAAVAVPGGTKNWLYWLVGVDAVLVLSGAVLTGYVGVVGLGKRLSLDRILPQFLLTENRLRRTCHWIIISFFALCSSLYLLLAFSKDPRKVKIDAVNTLSGVYTSAFLCVMAMFAISNMMLKYKRSQLPRELIAPWPVVIIAFLGVTVAFIANLMANPSVLPPFAAYFVGTMALFVVMFLRINLLKILLYFIKMIFKKKSMQDAIARKIQDLNSSKVIFFTRDDNIAILNKAVLYIRDNEQTNWILMVCVYKSVEDIPPKLEEVCHTLDTAYPKFRIDPVIVNGEFGPQLIDQLSLVTGVPKNFMFITTPSEHFTHKLSDFGGVRLVTR
eukprot:TRINITY_DN4166_c0_g1_i2.p1 TRINITY_DN4166_c0_g1~~TRINITY_DN4166_c0_g1_i2.p1  ORF type:complete len:690 (-),score=187.13 TRINITY_DN4166_c0_g1_i2:69-2084(-)